MNEAKLIAMAQTGDRDAFDQLVSSSLGNVLGSARRILRSESEAWDSAQEAYLRAWTQLAKFRGAAKFSTWVVTIVTRICLDTIRARKRRAETKAPDSVESDRPGPAVAAVSSALGEALANAITNLPEPERVVFVLHHESGMRYREIADKLEIPIGTVMSRLHAARLRMREKLEPWWKEMKS